jgi:DNA-binding NtrC family response regulator
MAATLSDQTVLIVEDQEGPRRALTMILSSFYRILTAETAAAGLKAVLDHPIDLVIMDVGLPDYSGIELLRQVRASGRNVKAIVMSGGASIESAEEVLRLGAVAYLLKPFNFQELLTLVENALKVTDANLTSS